MKNPGVAAVILLLDGWLQAMESGTAHLRLPDPSYIRADGKPLWTVEQLDTLIRDLDAEIDQEVTRLPGTSVGAQAGPGFWRLALPQRLALAQGVAGPLRWRSFNSGAYRAGTQERSCHSKPSVPARLLNSSPKASAIL